MLKDELSKTGNPSLCPVAVIIRDGKILQGMRNYTPDKWKQISVWTTPGGRCDEGETLEQTVRREVAEEVGITELEIKDYIGEVSGAKEGDSVPIFYATTTQDAKLMEPEKFSEWRWVPVEEYMQEGPYSSMNPAAHKVISEFLRKAMSF